jgi:hypothetical protein
MLGDWANQTDNVAFGGQDVTLPRFSVIPAQAGIQTTDTSSLNFRFRRNDLDSTALQADDRWVFTEEHPGHEYKGIMALAIGGRVLHNFNAELSAESITAAEALYAQERDIDRAFGDWLSATGELYLATGKDSYRDSILARSDQIIDQADRVGWIAARFVHEVGDPTFTDALREAVAAQFAAIVERQKESPYGVPYRPHIWGAGWGIQQFGVEQYFLHRAFPGVVSPRYMLNAMNFVLGVHPGANTKSFASGVGANSITTAYGFNRADWSYIPGGVVSGTALIRPDFPELKNWPYLWQQGEYVMGGGASNFMFLVLAANEVLSN